MDEKRTGEAAVPEHPETYMNAAQLAELHKIENFGWKIAFIRRPMFETPIIMVSDASDTKLGMLDEDGRLVLDPDIETRHS